jgi:LacI family transcriptional regulator
MARASSTTRKGMIALVISDVANPFYVPIIRGAEEAASLAGYTMLLSDTQESDQRERVALERAIPAVDGIVLASSRMSDSAIRMTAKQIPTIVLNRPIADVPSVVTDNPRGARRALEHLGELGHDCITYLAGPEASWADGMRWRALLEASHELDLRVRKIGPFPPTVQGGVDATEALVASPTSAVIAYNDQLAIGLMRGLQARGVTVPGEVSVVGFDNILPADLVTPGLTTVAAPLLAMGATAVQNLLAYIGGAQGSRQPIVLPTRLVVRASTGQRSRKRTSPAWGTTRVSGSAASASRSTSRGSR